MPELECIGLITHLKVTEENKKIEIFNFSNNTQQVDLFFSQNDFLRKYGFLEKDEFLMYSHAYFKGEPTRIPGVDIDMKFSEKMGMAIGYLRLIIQCMWFVKDNSVNLSNSICHDLVAGSNSMIVARPIYTNALGGRDNTEFSITETLDLYKVIYSIRKLNTFPDNVIESLNKDEIYSTFGPSAKNIMPYNSAFNKIKRALIFLDDARKNESLPKKISHYMSVLECLFTSNQSNIKRTLTERVSFYLQDEISEDSASTKIINDAYGIRSNFLHGDSLKKKYNSQKNLQEISKKVDSIVRMILKKILLSEEQIKLFSMNSETINKYFESKIKRTRKFRLNHLASQVSNSLYKFNLSEIELLTDPQNLKLKERHLEAKAVFKYSKTQYQEYLNEIKCSEDLDQPYP